MRRLLLAASLTQVDPGQPPYPILALASQLSSHLKKDARLRGLLEGHEVRAGARALGGVGITSEHVRMRTRRTHRPVRVSSHTHAVHFSRIAWINDQVHVIELGKRTKKMHLLAIANLYGLLKDTSVDHLVSLLESSPMSPDQGPSAGQDAVRTEEMTFESLETKYAHCQFTPSRYAPVWSVVGEFNAR